uniref:ATP synthase complex subunit 8 n=1 Tax=Heliocidaris crassispina TaxID=1043166 RepID=A0A516F0A1_HELCR|nr:ATP synthase F0 subunit 8 [Heliocidaris crassispina]
MPQLDFAWWVVNFFIIWISVLTVLILLLSSTPSQNINQSSSLNIKKESTTWQWL